MSSYQREKDIFFQMPNSMVEKSLWTILCKLGEIEEELQCSVPVHQRIGCAAHAKGILPDSNIGLKQKSKINMLSYQKEDVSYFFSVEELESYNNLNTHSFLEKKAQKKPVLLFVSIELRVALYLLWLIIHRISRVFLCIFLHRFVSPCQCPYIKTCELILSQKKAKALEPMPKLIPIKLRNN